MSQRRGGLGEDSHQTRVKRTSKSDWKSPSHFYRSSSHRSWTSISWNFDWLIWELFLLEIVHKAQQWSDDQARSKTNAYSYIWGIKTGENE